MWLTFFTINDMLKNTAQSYYEMDILAMKLKVNRDVLVKAMGRKFLGQVELAKATGLSLQTISDIIQEKRTIGMKTAKAICEFLGLSFEELIIVEF